MVSAIDATKPLNGVPAVKSDLRANLQAAKDEIEEIQAGSFRDLPSHTTAALRNLTVEPSLTAIANPTRRYMVMCSDRNGANKPAPAFFSPEEGKWLDFIGEDI